MPSDSVPKQGSNETDPPEAVQVASVVDQIVKILTIPEGISPSGQVTDLRMAKRDAENVAIVIDGMGSEFPGGHVSILVDAIRDETEFKVRRFSYKGIEHECYTQRDTIQTPVDHLVAYLDQYVHHYSEAKRIVLIGYSLGGLIVSEWMHRRQQKIAHKELESSSINNEMAIRNIEAVCLVASPIRIRELPLDFPHYDCANAEPIRIEARDCLSTLLGELTFDPGSLHLILPLYIFRCKKDILLDDRAYKFDQEPDSGIRQEKPVPPFTHFSIIRRPDGFAALLDHLKSMVATASPHP